LFDEKLTLTPGWSFDRDLGRFLTELDGSGNLNPASAAGPIRYPVEDGE
jgi:hypothetical protein